MDKSLFDPNQPGQNNGNYFGLPFSCDEATIVLIPVPWDVTTSYRPGTASGPGAMLEASLQIDLFDLQYGNAWEKGIATARLNAGMQQQSASLRKDAEVVIASFEQGGGITDAEIKQSLEKVNAGCQKMVDTIYQQTSDYLKNGKLVGLVGGDHSIPLGYLKALAEHHQGFGILHIDAHADLRKAYEGFTYSHASIMYNALQINGVQRVVQLGIRDVCDDEMRLAREDLRIHQFTDYEVNESLFAGTSWQQLCQEVIECLPEKVYISFDIDGLQASLCPNTGTPVPGGLGFEQAVYLLRKLSVSGKELIGFDLCEVSPGPDEWDANVGARILFKLCSLLCTMTKD
jgi:agmatinase